MLQFFTWIDIVNLAKVVRMVGMVGLFDQWDDHLPDHISPEDDHLSLIKFCRIDKLFKNHRRTMHIRCEENARDFSTTKNTHLFLLISYEDKQFDGVTLQAKKGHWGYPTQQQR